VTHILTLFLNTTDNSCTAISFFGDISGGLWPPLPDLNVCDFYLCNILKGKVHNNPYYEDSLRRNTQDIGPSISPAELSRAMNMFFTIDAHMCMCVCELKNISSTLLQHDEQKHTIICKTFN
jgi:hypothetical protein